MINKSYYRHLDVVVYTADNDTYPDSGLNLVNCSDDKSILACC